MLSFLSLLLHDAFFSAIPAVGFAMVFNVPKRYLIYCAIAGAIGHSSRTFYYIFQCQLNGRHLSPQLLLA